MRVHHWSPQLLLIIILPLALFWRWLFLGEVLYWGTLLFQFWPWHQLVKMQLLAGDWPLWNPLLGNGTPLLANLQSAVFYPLNLLYLLLPVEQGLTLSIVLHLMLAGLFMVAYARQLGLSPFAALLSALTFMFSGYLIGRTQFVPMINTAAWLPLLLLLCEDISGPHPRKRRGGLAVIGLGLGLALAILAGHAQLWFYTLCLLAVYTLVRGWQKARLEVEQSAGLAVIRAGWRLGLATMLALLLAAAQLLPTAEFVLQSDRGGGAERIFAVTYSFWPWRLITLLAPNFFGHPASGDYWGYANFWEDHAYQGILPLLLALVAIWHYLRSRLNQSDQAETSGVQSRQPVHAPPYRQVIPFYALLIPVSLLLAMGWNTPVYLWVFETIPGFAYFQAPARLLIWYTVAVAILAGAGAQIFAQTPPHRPTWRRLLVASIGLGLATLAGGLLLSGRSRTFLMATFSLGVWLVLSISVLLSRPDDQGEAPAARWRNEAWQWAMIAVVSIDLLLAAFPLILTLPASIFTQPITSAEFLKSQPENRRFYVTEETNYAAKFDQFFRFDTFGPANLNYWQTFRETLVPNLGVYADLPSTNNDDPLRVGRWQQFTNLLGRSDPAIRTRLLALANVGYLLDNSGENVGPPVYDSQNVTIQQVADPLPRAYFVAKAYRATSHAEAIARLTAPNFDSRQEVVIIGSQTDTLPAATLIEPIDQPSSAPLTTNLQLVPVTGQSPNLVTLTVDADQPGFVVLTDTYYPGWQATVDGQPVQIWPANLAFRAVPIEAGRHTVQFSYRPATVQWGVWISGITLLFVLLAGGRLLLRNRNQRI